MGPGAFSPQQSFQGPLHSRGPKHPASWMSPLLFTRLSRPDPPSPPTLLLLTLPNLASRTPPSFAQGETWEALNCLPLLHPSPLSPLVQPAPWPWLPWALGRLLQIPPYNLPFALSQGQLFKNVTVSPPCWKPSGSFPCLQDQDTRALVLTSGIQQPEEPCPLILQLTAPNSIPCPLAELIPSVLSRDGPPRGSQATSYAICMVPVTWPT